MRKKIFLVGIKNSGVSSRTSATTALEAMTKYCQKQGFNYRVFANKLKVEVIEDLLYPDKRKI